MPMRKSRFTEEQIAHALRQAETGTPVTAVCRAMGVSEQTYYRWKKSYGGLRVHEIRRLKLLEEENRRPGKPTYNALVESFNGQLRDECPEHQLVPFP